MKFSFLISILMLSAMLGCSSPALSVIDPMTEGMHEPEALHTASPRLSWKIQSGKNEVMQESYRILAATSEDLLYEGKADLWDSGNVESGISVLIPYEGKEIESSSKVWWKVKVMTNIGTAESSPTWFRTGMLNSAEIKASWIGKEFEDDVLEIKKLFIPLSSSNTQSGNPNTNIESKGATDNGGAPKKDAEDLTESGEQNQEDA